MLYGREAELAAVGALLATVRRGGSGALVVRGEPGIGKTALLAHADLAGLRVLRAAGVESEAELPFAGLHLLLRPVLDRLDAVPAVQAEALRGALGLAAAGAPDRFLVGLAVLSLLSEVADDGPLLAVVDDAQWLDRASGDALLFAARRLDAEPVGVLFAARTDGFPAPGVPELALAGLDPSAAAALLAAHAADLDAGARYRVLAEAVGNPLALIELPAAAASGAGVLPDRLREAFQARVRTLPEGVRTLLEVAAADDTGEVGVLLRAAGKLGAGRAELDDAVRAGLLTGQRPVAFRHPLVRAAVWQDTPPGRRLAVHEVLAAALDGPADADRRAWHLASATTGTDERVAAELERTAAWAGERAGHAAAAAAYERAAGLSAAPAARLRRLTLAAEAAAEAGDLDRSDTLAVAAERGDPDDPVLAARLTAVRAAADFWRGALPSAHARLLSGAARVAGTDRHLALRLLVDALHVGWYAGERELVESVARLRPARVPDDPLTPLAGLLIHAAAPVAGVAEDADGTDWAAPGALVGAARAAGDEPGAAILVAGLGLILGQEAATIEVAGEEVARARRRGRVGRLPQALFYLACGWQFAGRPAEAAATAEEGLAIARDTDQRQWVDRLGEPQAYRAAMVGDEDGCRRVTDGALAAVAGGDPAWQVPWVYAARGLLELGHGRAEPALEWLAPLAQGRARFHVPATRSTPDLVEAAVRAGRPELAVDAFTQFRRWAGHVRQPWVDAVVRRCRALLEPDGTAEESYRAALAAHRGLNRAFDEARTALLYGEWLRRARRPAEARGHLSAALDGFERCGAAPWAARARTELGATGTATPRRPDGPAALLTPQELRIVRLAAAGLSNKDIATQLFLSARTVGYHLYKAYPKLGVVSRGELAGLGLDAP
ncbi:LuxR family transcriptional regulator [Micromonospora auratinigra]|uniref:Regulatory protein, luxR family n=1 Tax=Micromonospora auratinigra TaxID=261654 RepID=A0A1A8Z8L9_9ACTN|nr:LuxR family transcriptional regulator [Micromonospora auratinigra]SBT40300.1 regulatory protein, luxR family [Micromonospora auratinigra]